MHSPLRPLLVAKRAIAVAVLHCWRPCVDFVVHFIHDEPKRSISNGRTSSGHAVRVCLFLITSIRYEESLSRCRRSLTRRKSRRPLELILFSRTYPLRFQR